MLVPDVEEDNVPPWWVTVMDDSFSVFLFHPDELLLPSVHQPLALAMVVYRLAHNATHFSDSQPSFYAERTDNRIPYCAKLLGGVPQRSIDVKYQCLVHYNDNCFIRCGTLLLSGREGCRER